MNISFNYMDRVISILDEQGDVIGVYTSPEWYLADYPERGSDCVAIGWVDTCPTHAPSPLVIAAVPNN